MIKNADGVWENTELENQEATNAEAIVKLQIDSTTTMDTIDWLMMGGV
jgi:hypothetical protein